MFKRGDRYKLFKFEIDIDIDQLMTLNNLYKILDELPDFKFSKIHLNRASNEFVNTFTQKILQMKRQDLFKVLKIDEYALNQQPEAFVFISKIDNVDKYDMS